MKYIKRIRALSNYILDEDITQKVKIEIVDDMNFLARLGCDEFEPNVLEISKMLVDGKHERLFTKVILHELAHYVCIKKYKSFSHGEKYKHTCKLLGIPYYYRIPIGGDE